jgi:flagellar hook protein FlgE
MFETIHLGLTGLTSFSRNLTVIGNNVSNLNTPGFKASQLAFSDLVYANLATGRNDAGASLQLGSGVVAGSARMLFTQGSVRSTGNPTDLAIEGSGFFVTRAEDRTLYTRAGDFQFDADGFLVSRTGARVAAFAGGGLEDLNIAGIRATAPRATTTMRFIDNLTTTDSPHDVTVTAFDSLGGSHALTLRFTNNGGVVPGTWLVDVREGTNLIHSGTIGFGLDGTPAAGANSVFFTLPPRAGAAATPITLEFGTPGAISGGATSLSGPSSELKLQSQDGFAAGTLTQSSFDAEGVLTATYSNGQTLRHQRIALAFFDFPQNLEAVGEAAFENRTGQRVLIGAPAEGALGTIAPQSLESANVDLAQQFSELIISQRGYQASSQVVSTANEMIQQLFDIRSRR